MIRAALLTIAILALGCTSAPKYPTLPADLNLVFEKAEKTYIESHADPIELAKAQDLHLSILQKHPTHAPSILGLGKIARRLGYQSGLFNYDKRYVRHSLQFMDRALEIDPKFTKALASKAVSLVILGDLEGANTLLEKAKDIASKEPLVWDASAQLNMRKGLLSQALNDASRDRKKACEHHRMGLRSIKFHTLRACFGTQLIKDGIAPAIVMKICGWKDLKTMQLYIRLAGIEVKGATDGLKILPDQEVAGRVIELFGQT